MSHCYEFRFGDVYVNNGYWPSGPVKATTSVVPCCITGDTCLAGGLCICTHYLSGGSGYYTGACTDPKWQDSSCKRRCGKLCKEIAPISTPSSTGKNKLSPGAAAGIGVAALAGVIIVLVAVWFLFQWRQMKGSNPPVVDASQMEYANPSFKHQVCHRMRMFTGWRTE